jgi:hypothetical protein
MRPGEMVVTVMCSIWIFIYLLLMIDAILTRS